MLTISLISAQISILLYKRLALERELMSSADKSDGHRREGRGLGNELRLYVTLDVISSFLLSGVAARRGRKGTPTRQT